VYLLASCLASRCVFLDFTIQLRHSQRMHTHTPMNTRTQTLSLWAFSKTEPANPRNWRSHHRRLVYPTIICIQRNETKRRYRTYSDPLFLAFDEHNKYISVRVYFQLLQNQYIIVFKMIQLTKSYHIICSLCRSTHLESNTIEFSILWFFCDLLWFFKTALGGKLTGFGKFRGWYRPFYSLGGYVVHPL